MKFELSPWPFFGGFLLGLCMLAVTGSALRPADLVFGFKRIDAGLNTLNFLATAREIKSIVDAVPQDKIIVIVGGTSVFQGTGQIQPYVWTNYLQSNLGPKFDVINFAQRAGRSNDFGNVAAEMLLREGRQVIFLFDTDIVEVAIPLEASFYSQVEFDAWRRGYLLPWPARDKAMQDAAWSDFPRLREAAWGSLFDLPLNFRDLWNYVSFEIKGSVWNSVYNMASFDPLRSVPDPEPSADWYKARGYPKGPDDDERDMKIVAHQLADPSDPRWVFVKTLAEQQYPVALRSVSLVNVDLDSPFYVDRLPDGHSKYVTQANYLGGLLRGIGFGRTTIGESNSDAGDYIDRVHMSVSGGVKMAANVAPEVRAFATALGYSQ